MRRMITLIVALFLAVFTVAAQSGSATMTPADLEFFRHVFMSVTNLHEKPAILEQQEAAYVRQFGLNQAEAALFHATAQQFRASLLKLKASADPIVTGKNWNITEADRARMNQLAADRDRNIGAAFERLMKGLGPAAVERIQALKAGPPRQSR